MIEIIICFPDAFLFFHQGLISRFHFVLLIETVDNFKCVLICETFKLITREIYIMKLQDQIFKLFPTIFIFLKQEKKRKKKKRYDLPVKLSLLSWADEWQYAKGQPQLFLQGMCVQLHWQLNCINGLWQPAIQSSHDLWKKKPL